MGAAITEVIQKARSMGAEFRITGEGNVLVRGLSSLPEELRDVLRGHKNQVFAYLVKERREPPIIWETGNVAQIRSLLVIREAELVVAQTHLMGNPFQDWYAQNQIHDLEIKIADLRRWLADYSRGG